MKRDDIFIVAAIGGVFAYALLRHPISKLTWDAFAGPKFYASLKEMLAHNDPVEIQRLKEKYDGWSETTQTRFDESLIAHNIKRPW